MIKSGFWRNILNVLDITIWTQFPHYLETVIDLVYKIPSKLVSTVES